MINKTHKIQEITYEDMEKNPRLLARYKKEREENTKFIKSLYKHYDSKKKA